MKESSFQQIIERRNTPDTDVLALLRKHKILPAASDVQETEFVLDEAIANRLQEAVAPHRCHCPS